MKAIKEKLKAKNEFAKKHIHKKLRRSMNILFIISIIIFGVVTYEILIRSIERRLAVGCIIVGFGIGMIVHRMFHISRHQDEEQVVSRIDRTGGVILVIYIIFSIFRGKIIGEYFQGPTVLAVTISVVFGIMVGRVWGMRRKVKKVLKQQEILG